MRRLIATAAVVLCGLLAGCDGDSSHDAPADTKPMAIQHAECAVCGMLVREQPAPRAQLVHRDGARRQFCSIADLLSYLQAPSPHGRVEAIYVERMDSEADPRELSTQPRRWLVAEGAFYVRGIPRPRIMGEPFLVFESRQVAEAVARRHAGEVLTWSQLQAQPSAGARSHGAEDSRGG